MTYLQIINRFKEIVNLHAIINFYSNGPISDINIKMNNVEFTRFHTTLQSVVTDNENLFTYRFRLYVFDQDKQDDNLREQIISDSIQNMNDVLKKLKNDYDDLSIIGQSSMTPFQQKFTEYCSGVYADIDIQVDAPNNPCDFPVKECD